MSDKLACVLKVSCAIVGAAASTVLAIVDYKAPSKLAQAIEKIVAKK